MKSVKEAPRGRMMVTIQQINKDNERGKSRKMETRIDREKE